MFNSNWIINRIGMIDFWYYDDQDFYFEDGRLLLRGSNGSGKSVTMQSFIPLLLDGDKRPSRIDPFGSKDRKLDNYMLEDDDGRDERTGYLYMEFKRQAVDVYATIGIGLRARSGKPLDSWYFCIDDNRRIGKDIKLYKNDRNLGKVCLTKTELKSVIGAEHIFDSQKEYMKMVNNKLFGFSDGEGYGELIQLLLQLRKPKLSKDFKPTDLHEIMENSLPSLSEEELRPMSEAIENMDEQKSILEGMIQSKVAADKIMSSFAVYNRKVFLEKLLKHLEFIVSIRDLETRHSQLTQELTSLENTINTTTQKLDASKTELSQYQQRRNQLLETNLTEINLKEQQNRAIDDKNSKQKNLESKQAEHKKRELRYKQTNAEHRRKTEKLELLEKEINDTLHQMEEECEHSGFEDHYLFEKEFLRDLNKKYDFSLTERQVRDLLSILNNGILLLREKESLMKAHDAISLKYDIAVRQRNEKILELDKTEMHLSEIIDEYIEKVHAWVESNKIFHPDKRTIQDICNGVQAVTPNNTTILTPPSLNADFSAHLSQLNKLRADKQSELASMSDEEASKKNQLSIIQAMGEIQPERSCQSIKNREHLDKRGIKYIPFYKLIDFKETVSHSVANNVEEALLNMGLLDALVVPEQYRDAVLDSPEGMCDKYIFSGKSFKDSLDSLLKIDDSMLYTHLGEALSGILQSIYYDAPGTPLTTGTTSVNSDGRFSIGILTGNSSGNYIARFIGERAQRRYKADTIATIQLELEHLSRQMDEVNIAIATIDKDIATLDKEFASFPRTGDVTTAADMVKDSLFQLEKAKEHVKSSEDEKSDVETAIEKINQSINKQCAKITIPLTSEDLKYGAKCLDSYREFLGELKGRHGQYIHTGEQITALIQDMEYLEADIDDILCDIRDIEREIERLTYQIDTYEKQLSLTEYEKIKQEIDLCTQKTIEIPPIIESLNRELTRAEMNRDIASKEILQTGEKLQQQVERSAAARQIVVDELNLEYIHFENPPDIDNESQLNALVLSLSDVNQRDISNLKADLQTQFHIHSDHLKEYSLNMNEVFENNPLLPELPVKRLEINCRVKGRQARLADLTSVLAEEIEVRSLLLNESDRRLFEEILGGDISRRITARIYKCDDWVNKMNAVMQNMDTSSGLTLHLTWRSKKPDTEEQLSTSELVDLLKKDASIRKDSDFKKITTHFNSKISQARKQLEESENVRTLHTIMRDILDYRKWFEFQLYFKKTGERQRELTNKAFSQFSGGEKAMTMYVPLFSAVTAKYQSARPDAPKIIALDEAFAGVDDNNIRDMFKLCDVFDFSFIMNSQALWGDYDTVPRLSIYQLHRPNNAKFVVAERYIWNGHTRMIAVEHEGVK